LIGNYHYASGKPAAEPTKESAAAPAADLKGKKVTVYGGFTGEGERLLQESWKPFIEKTGIDLQYQGSSDQETQIMIRIEANDAPDIGHFAQPGLVSDLVKKGKVKGIDGWFDKDYLKQQYAQSWLDMATVNGVMAGVWWRASVKSLVWYPVKPFKDAGYKIPQTWDEMIALSDKMVADGKTPWCVGIESSGATGWAATDWVEDIMLRTNSPEAYDKWTSGKLKFDSPEVKKAVQTMGDLWLKDKYVYGGVPSILTTPFGDSQKPLFDTPPGCYMHRQANFISSFFPAGKTVGPEGDVNYFYLPPIDPKYGKPVLVAGDLFVPFNDRPEVREVMKFLTTGESTKAWVLTGDFVAPQKDAKKEWYPVPARGFAEILENATVFRFDGSDLMPGAVGAGSFWTGMVEYVGGQDLDTVLKNIDAAWPK